MEIWFFEDSEGVRRVLKRMLIKVLGDQAIIREAENMTKARLLVLNPPNGNPDIVFIDGNLSPITQEEGRDGKVLERKIRELYPEAVVVDISLEGNALENPNFICGKELGWMDKDAVINDAIISVKPKT